MLTAKFYRGALGISIELSGYNEQHPEHTILLIGSSIEELRRNCYGYSINELKDIQDQLREWLLDHQKNEFDIPIGYRDLHARLGQVIDNFVAEYLLKDIDTEDAGK